MISVNKAGAPPSALGAGVQLTAANCVAFDANPAGYRAGTAKFEFKKTVYGPHAVKSALKTAQHHKCCFCEARFDANYKGDVEHFRPKGRILEGKRIIRPGYYWLAYSWENLYYACADCNQYRKRDQFPLKDNSQRAADHHGVVANEDALLIDPGGPRDPRQHIRFKKDVPVWTSEYGQATIKALKLDRDELNLSRRTHFEALDSLRTIIALLADDQRQEAIEAVRDARLRLEAAKCSTAIFSAASQDYLATFGL